MKKLAKTVALVMACIMLVLCFSACEKDKPVSSGDVSELTTFMVLTPTAYTEDMPIWKEAAKRTGITLKNVVSSVTSDESTAFSTMVAGGELPDIIRAKALNLRQLAVDGGMLPLNDLIEEHAPNIKKFFEECPEAKSFASVDGEIYYIPGSLAGIENEGTPSLCFMIRQDWLDKLGLEVPTTIDELHDVLYAFKTKDPNGNGKADEVPFFTRYNDVSGLMQLWGISCDFFQDGSGGLSYGPVHENYKVMIKELSKWYKEGILDVELYTRSSAREQLLGQNVGGCTVDWLSSTTKFNDTLKDSVPGINIQAMLPPKNINGEVKSMYGSTKLHSWAWGISSMCPEEKIIATIKYLDFWMSEEGRELMSFGPEGVSYTRDGNGNRVWTEEALTYDSGVPNYLRSIGTGEIGTVQSADATLEGMNEAGVRGYKMYENIIYPPHEQLAFTQEEQDILNECETNIITATEEQQQKWLLGKEDPDATWDKYIKTLKSIGLDKFVKVYNDAFKRMYGNK